MKTWWTLIGLTLMVVSLVACAAPSGVATEEGSNIAALRVVATTSIVADAVAVVGGERVAVTGLMGPGIDPHLYKASAGDVRAIELAGIIFYNGLHLEAAMATVLERMSAQRPTVAVTAGIDRAMLLSPPGYEGYYDPHVWFDVSLWMVVVETIRDALTDFDPAGAAVYEQNAAAYLKELEALDDYVKEQAGKLPAEKRVLITAHDAFNYFGRAYGFDVIGLQGISTVAEASTSDVQELSSLIVERRVPAVFIESSVSPRNIEAVQAAVQARGYTVRIGGELFSDALGSSDSPEATYIGMVRYNIDTIVSALLKD